jgi:hypothetical protein
MGKVERSALVRWPVRLSPHLAAPPWQLLIEQFTAPAPPETRVFRKGGSSQVAGARRSIIDRIRKHCGVAGALTKPPVCEHPGFWASRIARELWLCYWYVTDGSGNCHGRLEFACFCVSPQLLLGLIFLSFSVSLSLLLSFFSSSTNGTQLPFNLCVFASLVACEYPYPSRSLEGIADPPPCPQGSTSKILPEIQSPKIPTCLSQTVRDHV